MRQRRSRPRGAGVTQGVTPSPRYGQLKAECERVARRCFGDKRCLILRPGIILGPYEYVGRLPWLLRRMHRGGKVLAVGNRGRPIQPVDVRDVAAFILHAIADRRDGAMNVTATAGHATYGELLGACRAVSGAGAELIRVEDEWLARQDVTPWTEIPLWRANGAVSMRFGPGRRQPVLPSADPDGGRHMGLDEPGEPDDACAVSRSASTR